MKSENRRVNVLQRKVRILDYIKNLFQVNGQCDFVFFFVIVDFNGYSCEIGRKMDLIVVGVLVVRMIKGKKRGY